MLARGRCLDFRSPVAFPWVWHLSFRFLPDRCVFCLGDAHSEAPLLLTPVMSSCLQSVRISLTQPFRKQTRLLMLSPLWWSSELSMETTAKGSLVPQVSAMYRRENISRRSLIHTIKASPCLRAAVGRVQSTKSFDIQKNYDIHTMSAHSFTRYCLPCIKQNVFWLRTGR